MQLGSFRPVQVYSKAKQWVPLLSWLPKYKWKKDFSYDLVAGLTYSTVVIPQSMAYAMLAKLPPVYGLYTSIVPILLYSVFGTSRHLVAGTFALTSLMLGEAVLSILHTKGPLTPEEYEAEFLATTMRVTFVVGLIQVLFSFLRVGQYITKYLLPDPLISGFTNAAAIFIATSQFQNLFGIRVPEYSGVFGLVKTWGYVVTRLHETHLATFSLGFMSIMTIVAIKRSESRFQKWLARTEKKGGEGLPLIVEDESECECESESEEEHRNPTPVSNHQKISTKANVSTKVRCPLPDILLVILLYTIITWLFRLNDRLDISIIGHIPSGLPTPANSAGFLGVRDFFLHVKEGFLLAIVAYVMTISIAKNFAKKGGYQIDGNQEMFALGLSTAVSSFFSGYASCGSLTRTSVIYTTGGRSQIAAFIGTLVVVMTVFSLTSLFYYLPKAVLAGVILMACKSLFLHMDEVTGYWKHQRFHFFIWLATFVASVTVKAEFGIAVGMVISVVGIVLEKLYPCRSHQIP
ncbi:hypothetical protein K493DRAFT_288388 [Basidiobolus meristosporus CBS 931.73]|uniref:SLC26A/SulP transporter domain-containing protein n=1 Tax=Basidiobolus meristosporus CBS 931.73 TaxID=1314790 RepID=A0A1Y1XWU7_9FUNG|nr:hypothetical protein K493DRAFT_288388 [Basidiobolus meristosporus CBS 931.73]|eukprot:ORX90203.1 hypothetical protein K493DRAFT_288388 [Basidiobolus meristosporus CBS 931.73]